MAGRVVFFVQQGNFESAFQVGSLAVTAAAMGDEVHVVFSFGALRRLVQGTFGAAASPDEESEQARGEDMGVLSPLALLQEARALGARLWACETTVRLCGLTEEDCLPHLDEVAGLATLWRLTDGARVVSC